MNEPQYRRTAETLHSEIGDDIVALHIRLGHCYGMENVTADVWRLLDQDIGVTQICERLKERYEVDDDTCRSDVGKLIEVMKAESLIEIVDSAAQA